MSAENLYKELKQAKTEEDVKDIYIKALGLKSYSKNLVDIQTKEIWFEAKHGNKNSSYAMFTQLLHYVQVDLNQVLSFVCFIFVVNNKTKENQQKCVKLHVP